MAEEMNLLDYLRQMDTGTYGEARGPRRQWGNVGDRWQRISEIPAAVGDAWNAAFNRQPPPERPDYASMSDSAALRAARGQARSAMSNEARRARGGQMSLPEFARFAENRPRWAQAQGSSPPWEMLPRTLPDPIPAWVRDTRTPQPVRLRGRDEPMALAATGNAPLAALQTPAPMMSAPPAPSPLPMGGRSGLEPPNATAELDPAYAASARPNFQARYAARPLPNGAVIRTSEPTFDPVTAGPTVPLQGPINPLPDLGAEWRDAHRRAEAVFDLSDTDRNLPRPGRPAIRQLGRR